MAIVTLAVPRGVASYLTRLDVPGERTPVDEMHVTIVQMDQELDPVQVATIAGIVRDVVSKRESFQATLERITHFPPSDHGFPIICPVTSEGLLRLHETITSALDANRIEYSKKFPTYRPHVTVSWSTMEPPTDVGLVKPLTWTVDVVNMWPTTDGSFQAVRFELRRQRSLYQPIV